MGPNLSRQLSTVTQSIIAEAITNISNTAINNERYDSRIIQKIHVDYTGGDANRCPISISNTADLRTAAIARNSNTLSNDVKTEITAKIDTLVQQTLEQLNEGFPVGENKADVISQVAQYVNESIRTNLKNTIENSMSTNGSTDQEIDVDARYFRCRNSPITLNQASTVEAMASVTSDTVVSNLVSNKVVADLKAAIDQEVKQTLKGLDFGFIFIIIALIVIGVIVFLSKAAKKIPVNQVASGFKRAMNNFNLWLSKHRKAILIFLGSIGALLVTAYGLIRGGVVKNPFLPEYAQ